MTWVWIAVSVVVGLLVGLAVVATALSRLFSPFDPAKR